MLHNIKKLHNILFLLPLLMVSLLYSKPVHAETLYYDVTAFGANGYDTYSDSTAIQQALDMASAYLKTDDDDSEEAPSEQDPVAPTVVVTIPDGTYYISQALYIQSNTILSLSSNAVIRRMDSALDKNMIRTTDEDHDSDAIGGYDLAHDITITGGTWDGGNIYSAKKTCNLFYFGHSQNITIENTTILNCYGAHAIEFAGVNNGVIRNCSITGFRYGSNNFTAEAIQLDICYSDKKDGEWTPGFDLDKTTCQNILIENNTITDYPRGVGVHHTLKGYQVTNLTIQNNKFVRSSASTQGKSVVGIFLYGVQNATVYNNTFDRYSYGAMIKVCKKVTVKKNTFKYNNLGSLIVEGCDSNNGRHTFVVTSDDIGEKVLKFTRGNIKKGTVKTRGRTYKFKKTGEVTLKLKKKIKANQKITFYGKDTNNNKYYRIYYVPKQEKTTSK